jgi:hypothetical protein
VFIEAVRMLLEAVKVLVKSMRGPGHEGFFYKLTYESVYNVIGLADALRTH